MSDNKTQGIIALLDQYKDEKSLRMFAEAQMKTITNLTKKVGELEKKNSHLEKMLEDRAPMIRNAASPVKTEGLLTSDEEAIAVMELNRLRDVAMERALTLEESRKADLFHKMLVTIKNQPKTIVVESRKLSTEELLTLATTDDEQKTN